MKKRIILSVIGLVLLAGLSAGTVYLKQSGAQNNQTNTQQETPKVNNRELTYQGKDGATALDLLKQNATIESTGEGSMAYVTSINNVKPDSSKNEFWSFSVNGTPATVGAGSYVTKSTDTITWKIDTF